MATSGRLSSPKQPSTFSDGLPAQSSGFPSQEDSTDSAVRLSFQLLIRICA
jgi:hypothetical protein